MSFFQPIPTMSLLLFLFILLFVPPFDMILCAPLLNNTLCSRTKYINSPVLSNLAYLLPDLPRNASKNGFVNTSVGEGEYRVLGLAICLAGFPLSGCQNCLELAVKNLTSTTKCANLASAVSWYDHCIVHYSRAPFFGVPKNYSIDAAWGNKEANGGSLQTTVYNLIKNLSDSAANNPETRFALGQETYLLNSTSNTTTIYGLAQCTRELSSDSCSRCLAHYTATLMNNTAGKGSTYTGARLVGESCFIWYDDKPLNSTTGDQNTEIEFHNNTAGNQNSESGNTPPGGTQFHSAKFYHCQLCVI